MTKSMIILIALEILLPFVFGIPFAISDKNVNGRKHFAVSSFACGQAVLYSVFQITTVYSILKNRAFPDALKLFVPAACAVFLISLSVSLICFRKRFTEIFRNRFEKISFWGILGFLIFVFMMVMSFLMTYTDGDDAYYVTTAAEAVSSDSMYAKDPYTGMGTISSFRYMSAPYPIWLAFLSRVSGIHATALAHTFFPWSMILLSFSVIFLLARNLFEGDHKKRGIFVFFSSVLVMFGDYSIYSPENFLLARSRQGKAALAAFILPFLVCLMISVSKQLSENGKITFRNLMLITVTGFAASLCSTIGGSLCFALVGACALCFAFAYKKIKYPLLMICMSLPALAFVLLYLVKR